MSFVGTLSDAQSEWLDTNPLFFSSFRSPAQCVVCNGTKTYRWWDGARHQIIDHDCDCREQWILSRWMSYCGIGLAFQRMDWFDLLDIDVDLMMRLRQMVAEGGFRSFTLSCPSPAGKTRLAVMMLKTFIASGRTDVRMVAMTDAMDSLAATWGRQSSEWAETHLGLMAAADALVIDDVGADLRRHRLREDQGEEAVTRLSTLTLDKIFRQRANQVRWTTITTRLGRDDFASAYGSTATPILDATEWIDLAPQSSSSFAVRLADERSQGLSRPIVLG
jgi:hypothetical protein